MSYVLNSDSADDDSDDDGIDQESLDLRSDLIALTADVASGAKDTASIQSGVVVIEGLAASSPETLTDDDQSDTLGTITWRGIFTHLSTFMIEFSTNLSPNLNRDSHLHY